MLHKTYNAKMCFNSAFAIFLILIKPIYFDYNILLIAGIP